MEFKDAKRAEAMKQAIALWQASGLSKYAFCKREKIDRTTLNYWLVKYGFKLNKPLRSGSKVSKSKNKSKSSFVSVHVNEQAQSEPFDLPQEIELEYPNGVKLRLPSDLSHEQLCLFIKLY